MLGWQHQWGPCHPLAGRGAGQPPACLSHPNNQHLALGAKTSGAATALPGAALPPPAVPLPSLTEEPGDFNDRGGFPDSRLCWTKFSPTRFPDVPRHCQLFSRGSLCSCPSPWWRHRSRWEPARPPVLTHGLFTHTHTQIHTQNLCHVWPSPARPTLPGSAVWATGWFRKGAGNPRAWTGEVELEP